MTTVSRLSAAFHEVGAEHFQAVLPAEAVRELLTVAERMPANRAGVRLFGAPSLQELLGPQGSVGRLATTVLGAAARPVRAVLFDKTQKTNWLVPWHQDRTIAVRDRGEADGFRPWSIKAGVHHVEPPFELLAGMMTLRVHLDDCDEDNAPLLIAPGSHLLGRVRATDAQAEAERIGGVACLAQAGDVWLYATPILHASDRAKRPRRRRVLQVDYAMCDLPDGLDWIGIA